MDVSEIPQLQLVSAAPADARPWTPAVEETAPAGEATYEHCDECGSAVDTDQRYCVACGAHRRPAPSPLRRASTAGHPRGPPTQVATGESR